MSIFNEGMDLASNPAMNQMGEVVHLNGVPIQVIIDPVEKSNSRIPGGKQNDSEAIIFMRREDFYKYNVAKGDKITVDHTSGGIRVRVSSVQDDGTDLLILNCSSLLTGVVPK